MRDGVVRDLSFCENECESIAKQIDQNIYHNLYHKAKKLNDKLIELDHNVMLAGAIKDELFAIKYLRKFCDAK